MSPRTTHVANACDCPVWAACIPDQTTSMKLIAKINENLKIEVNKSAGNAEKLSGLTKIRPGDSLAFVTDSSHFTGEMVYVVIFYEASNRLHPVTEGFQVEANQSVIVNPKYSLKLTEMGTIWTDTSGVRYK
ncbi:unnamed protein product [Adineta steineri]|uniref:Uncharacterized protein n=2 Tax=Adineta steineri TaxID=433720 RepID=A0A814P6G3_9BILA|nr:unnamed protein product [Adineta steineri]